MAPHSSLIQNKSSLSSPICSDNDIVLDNIELETYLTTIRKREDSLETEERVEKARENIQEMNEKNYTILQNRQGPPVYDNSDPPKPQKIYFNQIKSPEKTSNFTIQKKNTRGPVHPTAKKQKKSLTRKIGFKIYSEDELHWPIESFLITNSA